MATNAAGFNESIVLARDRNYPYQTGMGMINSREWIVHFDDFIGSEASDELNYGGYLTLQDAGETLVNADEHGGAVTISSDGTSEGIGFYLPKCIKLTGKKFFMEVRAKTADADDTDLVFGLSDLSATSDPEDLWDTSNADGIACGVFDGSAALKLIYDKDNTGPVTETSTVATLSDATYATLAISYNGATDPGNNAVQFWKDGVLAGAAGTNAQIPEDVVLAPFFAFRTGGDAAHTGTFDYFRWAVER